MLALYSCHNKSGDPLTFALLVNDGPVRCGAPRYGCVAAVANSCLSKAVSSRVSGRARTDLPPAPAARTRPRWVD